MMAFLIERCPLYTGTCDGVPNREVSSIGIVVDKCYKKQV